MGLWGAVRTLAVTGTGGPVKRSSIILFPLSCLVPSPGYTLSSQSLGPLSSRLVPTKIVSVAQDYSVLKYTTSNSLDRKELLMGVNFARNFLDDLLLPWGVARAVYLDVDTVVQGDLVRLGETQFKEGKLFAAVRRKP
eukprot:855545-Prorocentrum_minimum.AAC.1